MLQLDNQVKQFRILNSPACACVMHACVCVCVCVCVDLCTVCRSVCLSACLCMCQCVYKLTVSFLFLALLYEIHNSYSHSLLFRYERPCSLLWELFSVSGVHSIILWNNILTSPWIITLLAYLNNFLTSPSGFSSMCGLWCVIFTGAFLNDKQTNKQTNKLLLAGICFYLPIMLQYQGLMIMDSIN